MRSRYGLYYPESAIALWFIFSRKCDLALVYVIPKVRSRSGLCYPESVIALWFMSSRKCDRALVYVIPKVRSRYDEEKIKLLITSTHIETKLECCKMEDE